MSVPMKIPSSNISKVMATILNDFRQAKSIACCGLGALTGGLSCDVVAKVMSESYDKCMGKGDGSK
jgi:hypothetical protein